MEKRNNKRISLLARKWELKDRLTTAAFKLWGAAILLAAVLGAYLAIF